MAQSNLPHAAADQWTALFFFFFLNLLTYSFYGRPVSRHCADRKSEVIELFTIYKTDIYTYIIYIYRFIQGTMTMSDLRAIASLIKLNFACFGKSLGRPVYVYRSTGSYKYTHIYIYICIFVCMCVCYLLVPCI